MQHPYIYIVLIINRFWKESPKLLSITLQLSIVEIKVLEKPLHQSAMFCSDSSTVESAPVVQRLERNITAIDEEVVSEPSQKVSS